jgi:hypothetical protein
MHSRAYILLQRDFRELKYSNYEASTGAMERVVSLSDDFKEAV